MSNTFNVEELGKIQQALELLQEVVPTGKKGIENAKEIAAESGAVKYMKSAESLEAGGEEFFKCVEEYTEVIEELLNFYKRMDAGLNG